MLVNRVCLAKEPNTCYFRITFFNSIVIFMRLERHKLWSDAVPTAPSFAFHAQSVLDLQNKQPMRWLPQEFLKEGIGDISSFCHPLPQT